MLTYQQAKDIEDALGPQQAGPLLAVLQDLDRKIEDQKNAVKADLLLELATKADIANVRTEIADLRTELKEDMANLRAELKEDMANLRAELKEDMVNLRAELKEDMANLRAELKEDMANLRAELKGDNANLRQEFTASFAFLNGKIDTEVARLAGEFKSIRLWMKLLVAIGILGMTFFSPTTIKLLEMLK
jgi:chromosome segregation ATPase